MVITMEELTNILTPNDLSQIIELFGIGFAVGIGGGAGAFILSLIINLFYGVADD